MSIGSGEKSMLHSLSVEIREQNKAVLQSVLDGLAIYEQGVEDSQELINLLLDSICNSYKWGGYKVALGLKNDRFYTSDLSVIDAYTDIAKSLLLLAVKGVEKETDIMPRFRHCIESALSELVEGRAE
ncbi:hypothetical protein [Sediminitomix flava]|uniref:Uncharacterized protein n=1 Tax=Sediminitomix flava TaxID=379075 RepID=A0A315Z9I8_SEDFL|nr:hypothetical protein [Sediminitomix flava]PWJ41089.1 hypothetical protein BC781_104364 [Sediminitomix flava]